MLPEECKVGRLMWEGTGIPGTALAHTWHVCLFVIAITFVTSSLTRNYSQVDKLWSILPWLYAWILVVDTRTLLMALLATLWGLRLTYNFNRRGGYQWPPWAGGEDYRWSLLQQGVYIPALKNRLLWHIFNFVFVSFYQNLLLWFIAFPSMVAHLVATHECFAKKQSSSSLNPIDAMATLLLLAFLTLETLADNEQYAFQTEKYRRKNAGEKLDDGDFKDGFYQSGLFAVVRKPNYTGEQGVWCAYYLFSVAALWSIADMNMINKLMNASMIGCTLLILLFQGSGPMTEFVTISKYPSYKEYQKRVPLYVPRLFGGSPKTTISSHEHGKRKSS